MSAEIGIQFFKKWKRSLLEIEEYKAQSLQAQLQNLKNQVNPHFLFNNLSVLSSLVYKDQDKAADFIQQLSKVYRYLLDNNNNELVTLEDEMKFIESYNYLLQIRFDKNLIVDTHIQKDELQKMLPPISLQLLMENAIKHNEVSSEWPLKIDIFTQDDVLVVKNNLQTRTNQEPTSKTGLKNIQQRYAHFTKREVEVIISESEFTVKLPLIKLS
jgi:LytS/YehU family sensor histidine kinase